MSRDDADLVAIALDLANRKCIVRPQLIRSDSKGHLLEVMVGNQDEKLQVTFDKRTGAPVEVQAYHIVENLIPSPNCREDVRLSPEEVSLIEFITGGQKRQAIQEYKRLFCVGTVAAKTVVEAWLSEMSIIGQSAITDKLLLLLLENRYKERDEPDSRAK